MRQVLHRWYLTEGTLEKQSHWHIEWLWCLYAITDAAVVGVLCHLHKRLNRARRHRAAAWESFRNGATDAPHHRGWKAEEHSAHPWAFGGLSEASVVCSCCRWTKSCSDWYRYFWEIALNTVACELHCFIWCRKSIIHNTLLMYILYDFHFPSLPVRWKPRSCGHAVVDFVDVRCTLKRNGLSDSQVS